MYGTNHKISQRCLDEYNKLFSRYDPVQDKWYGSSCGYVQPGPVLWITVEDSDVVYSPRGYETDASFMDRIERCKQTGKNLFFKEWKRDKYDPDAVY